MGSKDWRWEGFVGTISLTILIVTGGKEKEGRKVKRVVSIVQI